MPQPEIKYNIGDSGANSTNVYLQATEWNQAIAWLSSVISTADLTPDVSSALQFLSALNFVIDSHFFYDLSGTTSANAIELVPVTANQCQVVANTLTKGIIGAFVASANNTASVTLKLGSLTATSFRDNTGALLTAGSILAGSIYFFIHDGTNVRLINRSNAVAIAFPSFSTTLSGGASWPRQPYISLKTASNGSQTTVTIAKGSVVIMNDGTHIVLSSDLTANMASGVGPGGLSQTSTTGTNKFFTFVVGNGGSGTTVVFSDKHASAPTTTQGELASGYNARWARLPIICVTHPSAATTVLPFNWDGEATWFAQDYTLLAISNPSGTPGTTSASFTYPQSLKMTAARLTVSLTSGGNTNPLAGFTFFTTDSITFPTSSVEKARWYQSDGINNREWRQLLEARASDNYAIDSYNTDAPHTATLSLQGIVYGTNSNFTL